MQRPLRRQAALLVDAPLVVEMQLLSALAVANVVLVTPDRIALAKAGIVEAVCPDLAVTLALNVALPQPIVELSILLVLPLQRSFLAQGRTAPLDVPGTLLLQIAGHGSAA